MTERMAVGIAIVLAAVRHPRFNEHTTATFIFRTALLLGLLVQRQCAQASRDMLGTLIAMGMAWGANRFVTSLKL